MCQKNIKDLDKKLILCRDLNILDRKLCLYSKKLDSFDRDLNILDRKLCFYRKKNGSFWSKNLNLKIFQNF